MQHIYCTRFWVRTWLWLKQYLMELLNDQDTYMELVDREVIGKQKELLVNTVRGVLGAKIEYITVSIKIDFYNIQNYQICCINIFF